MATSAKSVKGQHRYYPMASKKRRSNDSSDLNDTRRVTNVAKAKHKKGDSCLFMNFDDRLCVGVIEKTFGNTFKVKPAIDSPHSALYTVRASKMWALQELKDISIGDIVGCAFLEDIGSPTAFTEIREGTVISLGEKNIFVDIDGQELRFCRTAVCALPNQPTVSPMSEKENVCHNKATLLLSSMLKLMVEQLNELHDDFNESQEMVKSLKVKEKEQAKMIHDLCEVQVSLLKTVEKKTIKIESLSRECASLKTKIELIKAAHRIEINRLNDIIAEQNVVINHKDVLLEQKDNLIVEKDIEIESLKEKL